jgi:putative membrane protein
MSAPGHRLPWLLLLSFLVVFIWSAVNPKDRFTWFLEVAPALAGMIVLMVTFRRFPLTPLLYFLIWIHAVILVVGGHYTYAEVPLFDWLRDALQQSRNNYDKVGHFAQGFVPAMIAREILLRRGVVQRRGWLAFLIICICLALSASYELFEWLVAVGTGSAADAFLGSQGDPWDTQKDMAFAFAGAVLALLLLSRPHDAAIRRFENQRFENRRLESDDEAR